MEHKPAVYTLVELHAELGGKINANKREAQRLQACMKHVEAVIQLLEPDFNLRTIAAKRRNRENPLFKKGEVFRNVLVVLRTAAAPMTAREISVVLYRSQGVDNPTLEQIRSLYSAINSSLRNHVGKTVEVVGEGMPARWIIKP